MALWWGTVADAHPKQGVLGFLQNQSARPAVISLKMLRGPGETDGWLGA